jgi:hypothetical protein
LPPAPRRYTASSTATAEAVEFYGAKDAADQELAEVLSDELGWIDKLEIVIVDFSRAEPTATFPG